MSSQKEQQKTGTELIEPARLSIVTGLSGAGKTTALRVFEDLDYFAMDGLPPGLAPEIASIMLRDSMRHFPGMAIGMDMRQDNFLEEFDYSLKKLGRLNLRTQVIFLDADDKALIRRYAETRRPHPLERRGFGLEAAIASERQLLKPLREMADLVIDSTNFSIHDLRRAIQRHLLKADSRSRLLRVNLVSFGFKYGIPNDADFVFDARFLDNPYFVEELRQLSGKDPRVADYVFASPDALEFRDKVLDFLLFTLPRMEKEGRYRVTVAIGCTGGRHRSVALAEALGKKLSSADYPIVIEHRNLEDDTLNK